MWVARIKLDSKNTLIGKKAAKHNINIFAFPLSYYYEDQIIVHGSATLVGDEINKANFLKELKKEKRVLNLEHKGDFIISTIKEPIQAKPFYNKNLIYIAPVLFSEKGYELLTIASFKREEINKVIELSKNNYNGELLSIQNKKIGNINVMNVNPELTDKQKDAINLAIKNGYYEVPRNIDIQKLAKLSKLSFSTYQVHLRKAEKKLIPYFFN